MFDRLAPDYDRLNTLLTFGLVRGWRRALVRAASVRSGHRALDVCTGTGQTLGELQKAVGPEGLAVGIDFTPAMLRRARGPVLLADALVLPFSDGTFDAAVSAFALRDVADQRRMVSEMARVTRAGGRVAVLEIGPPERMPLRLGFDLWFKGAVPRLAAVLGQEESHRFLVRSVAYLPSPEEMARMLGETGVDHVRRRDLTLGAARLFWGRRAGRSEQAAGDRGTPA